MLELSHVPRAGHEQIAEENSDASAPVPQGRPEAKRLPGHDGAQGDYDAPYSQDLTTKSKIPKARSERAQYN
jgi:hypothetical protein